MELSKQIKKYRHTFNYSQEDLAQRIFVTRQTISNWENDKSYPDILTLVLLSEIFNISLDELVKGDIETMKKEIQNEDVLKLNHYGSIFTGLFIFVVISALPLFMILDMWAFIPWGIIYIITMIFALKIEKIKKNNNIQTYKEIVAFSEGKKLDEIQQQKEIKKRKGQKLLLIIVSAFITGITCILIGFIINLF